MKERLQTGLLLLSGAERLRGGGGGVVGSRA